MSANLEYRVRGMDNLRTQSGSPSMRQGIFGWQIVMPTASKNSMQVVTISANLAVLGVAMANLISLVILSLMGLVIYISRNISMIVSKCLIQMARGCILLIQARPTENSIPRQVSQSTLPQIRFGLPIVSTIALQNLTAMAPG